MGMYSTKNHNGSVHTQGKFHIEGRQPGFGHKRNAKLSDAEVRDIRYRYYRTHEGLESIKMLYNQVKPGYIEKIIEYGCRLSAACEI